MPRPPRLSVARSAALHHGALAALGLLLSAPASADPTDPAITSGPGGPSSAVFQPSTCNGDGYSTPVALTNGDVTSHAFTLATDTGPATPSVTTVPAGSSVTVTVTAPATANALYASMDGRSVGSFPLTGCTGPTSTQATTTPTAATSTSTPPMPSTPTSPDTSAPATAPSVTSTTSSDSSTSTDSTDPAETTSGASAAGPTSSTGTGASTTASKPAPRTTSALPQAPAPSDDEGGGGLPRAIGITLAALGLALGGVTLYRGFR